MSLSVSDLRPPVRVSAVLATRNRRETLARILTELRKLPSIGEIVVADNGSVDGTLEFLGGQTDVRVVALQGNEGVAARNRAAELATGEYLLLLDDDSFPRAGAVETLMAQLDADPRLAVAGGLVRDIDGTGAVVRDHEPGTFDWWLRGGRDVPADGLPSFFFPECAALVRRTAFAEVAGYFEPYFHSGVLGLDVTTRLLALGWDVRYVPTAEFAHLKDDVRPQQAVMTRLRTRNEIWYFARHFPAAVAVRRIAFYLAFNLVLATYLRHPQAVLAGARDAWAGRAQIAPTRQVLSREVLRRAEINRGALHVRLLIAQARRRLRGDNSSALRRTTGQEFVISGIVRPVRDDAAVTTPANH